MECPNDEELRAWLDGGCDETTAAALETHVDRCLLCHALVAAIAKVEVPAGDRSAIAPVLERGGTIGRYRIVGVLGAGAMGVVYAAQDEALDRTVAVKLLGSAQVTSHEAAARLEREAQAMARVSHPNVVAVYEIGTYDGAPFVAMEHVDGVTLSDWLRDHRPKIDEVVRLFREAALGLAAVHRAGFVHRDFKPANVLVSRDGRVRIADFGLVHVAAGALTARPDGKESTESRLTAAGALIGTPAYLAPEQLHGRVDARSDQFSFCVALFEACFGQRPFQADTLDALGQAVRAGALALPKVVPSSARWLVPIVRRGLAYDPATRFPDMEALGARLARSPLRRRRWALAGVGTLAVAGALVSGLRGSRGPASECATVERALTGIWDAPRRQAIRAAFLAEQSPGTVRAREKVFPVLDAYAAEWVRRRRELCSSAYNGETAHGVAAAQMACLDRRLAELRVVSDLVANPDIDIAENAPQTVAELRSPDSCEREAAVVTNLSTEERALLESLAEVRLLWVGWRHDAALALVRKVLPASERARPAIHALALLRMGQLELRRSADVGIAQLRQATLLAEAAHDDEVRAEALTYLARAMSQRTTPSDLALGEEYAAQASAVLARLGGDRRLDRLVLVSRGVLLLSSERYEEALGLLERALGLLDHDPAPDPREHGRVIAAMGVVLAEMGRPADAVPLFERALALAEGSERPHSPALFAPVVDLGEALLRSGRARDAAPLLERAGALAELVDSRAIATAALALGVCRAELGDGGTARTLLERALAISNDLQPGDRLRFEVRLALGEYLFRDGQSARGQAMIEQALRDGGPGQESVAKARFALAQALGRAEHKRARELAEQARVTYASAGPRRTKEVAAIDVWLAKK